MKPMPPKWLIDSLDEEFLPAPEIGDFIHKELLNENSPLFNPEHLHLKYAKIGYLWTNTLNVRQKRMVAAMVELPKPPTQSSAWFKARYRFQLRQWFGTDRIDYLMTFDAKYMAFCEDINAVATIDHECYHCCQKTDEFGAPKFHKETGLPLFALQGHDVEEFVGIVERYGAKGGAGESAALAAAV
jgi:hypothetical protein